MKQKSTLLILLLVLILLITGAVFAYRHFSFVYTPDTGADTAQTAEADEGSAQSAADFTVFDGEKKECTLSSHKGKPVVVNFWATWCPPCRSELPAYQKLYETYGDKVDFMFVALTDGYQETESSVDTFIEENGYTFPVFYDLQGSAAAAYAVNSIPLSLFIGSDGTIRHSQLGAMDETALETQIKALAESNS